jgi:hypothetical protein
MRIPCHRPALPRHTVRTAVRRRSSQRCASGAPPRTSNLPAASDQAIRHCLFHPLGSMLSTGSANAAPLTAPSAPNQHLEAPRPRMPTIPPALQPHRLHPPANSAISCVPRPAAAAAASRRRASAPAPPAPALLPLPLLLPPPAPAPASAPAPPALPCPRPRPFLYLCLLGFGRGSAA